MNMLSQSKRIALLLGLICLLGSMGCKTATLHVNSVPKTKVELHYARHSAQIFSSDLLSAALIMGVGPADVNSRFRGEDIDIMVVASTNIYCQTGVKYLRN